MLIRWVTIEDKPAWIQLASTVADLFNSPTMATDKSFHDYMISKIKNFEALAAIDRMSGRCLGIIGFSKTNNRISWFAVQPDLIDEHPYQIWQPFESFVRQLFQIFI